jgi:hypothetical protein
MKWGSGPVSRLSLRPRLALVIVFAAVAAVTSRAAEANEVATAHTTAVIETPVIIVISADMDFGKIAYASAPGTVILSAASSATCTTSGGLLHTGNCQAATFDGKVRFLFALQVTLPAGNSITLVGPGGATMAVNDFTFRPGPGLLNFGANRFLILNLDGSYTFYAGGTLHVAANQAPGVYNGTFQIQLNYN